MRYFKAISKLIIIIMILTFSRYLFAEVVQLPVEFHNNSKYKSMQFYIHDPNNMGMSGNTGDTIMPGGKMQEATLVAGPLIDRFKQPGGSVIIDIRDQGVLTNQTLWGHQATPNLAASWWLTNEGKCILLPYNTKLICSINDD